MLLVSLPSKAEKITQSSRHNAKGVLLSSFLDNYQFLLLERREQSSDSQEEDCSPTIPYPFFYLLLGRIVKEIIFRNKPVIFPFSYEQKFDESLPYTKHLIIGN